MSFKTTFDIVGSLLSYKYLVFLNFRILNGCPQLSQQILRYDYLLCNTKNFSVIYLIRCYKEITLRFFVYYTVTLCELKGLEINLSKQKSLCCREARRKHKTWSNVI